MHYSTRPHDEYAPNNGPLKRQAPCSDVRRTTKRPKLAEWSKQDLADAWAELGLESFSTEFDKIGVKSGRSLSALQEADLETLEM